MVVTARSNTQIQFSVFLLKWGQHLVHFKCMFGSAAVAGGAYSKHFNNLGDGGNPGDGGNLGWGGDFGNPRRDGGNPGGMV